MMHGKFVIALKWLGTVFLFLLLTDGTSRTVAQRTYKRHCECEYMVNGRCAYTLLLPVGSNKESGVCPTESPNTGGGGTGSPTVDAKIETLQKNISQMETWNAEQSRQLNQLQSTLIGQQQGMVNLTSAAGQCTATCAAVQANVTLELTAMRALVANQSSAFDQLRANITSQKTTQEDQELRITQLNDQLNKTKTSVKSLEAVIANLQTQLASLKNSAFLCGQMDLIVTGNSSYLNDTQVTSSSNFDVNHGPLQGRINATGLGMRAGSWCPSERKDTQEWLQFDLMKVQPIYKLVTRGRQDYPQWVETYKFQYSMDGVNFTTFQDVVGDDQVFTGNRDRNTPQVNILSQPVQARVVRFLPLTACDKCNTCLRADVIGCVDKNTS